MTSYSTHCLKKTFFDTFQIHTYHAYTIYLFSCNNIVDIIIPGLLFGSLGASVASRLSMGADIPFGEIVRSVPKMLLWSWSNLLFFNLSNQRYSIHEDMLNKPWRPLPSGRLTPFQATTIFYYMYPIVFVVSLAVGGLFPSVLIVTLCYWYDDRHGGSSPFQKNIINGLGIGSFFAGPLEVVTRHSILNGGFGAAAWVGILMATIATTSHVQDLRDVDGDRVVGRRTLPIVIGDINARLVAAMGIFGWTWIASCFWNAGWVEASLAIVAAAAMVANMFLNRNKAGDVRTWKIFPIWMLGLFLIPVILRP